LLDLFRGAGGPGQLHTVITSGESLSISLTDEFFTTLNNVRLLNTYGTSETWDVSCYEVRPEDAGAQRIPVGKPVGNASLCILDESLQPLPPGVSGELYAGGIGLAQEYIGRPDITREQFLQNHLDELDTARLYRTGDVARFRADGTVELLGRSDRQIKLRGLRIETAEIEYQAQQFKGIKNSVVVLQGGSGGDEWLSLYLEPEPDVRPDCDRLREFLQTRLPRAMVPAEIVLLDNLPLTPSGKLDVLALPASEYSEELKQSYVEPQGELQTTIATIWAEALELEKVGANENFFALRGHSLLATRVIARVGEELGIEVPLQCLFEAPTVAGMAGSIEALRWASGAETQGHGSAGDREIVRL
jgi:acyl-coenzyme A synthetase/AMP-(fatty) acid ligase/acyl carrier protein